MKKRRTWIMGVLLLAVFLFTSGCSGEEISGPDRKISYGYRDAQNMLIAATERNRYEDIYTSQIWQVQINEDGDTFQDYLLQEVRTFLKELKTMNLLADEYGITLSAQEQEDLGKLADRFYESMTEADRAYTGASRDDIYEMYEYYHRANRLIDEVTKDTNLEISDSEAKVVQIQEIRISDRDTAMAVHDQVLEEKADFMAIAKLMSEDPEIERSVGYGEHPESYEREVFRLEAGEISSVIETDQGFYIVKCIKDFDEEAILERKEKLALQRKNQAFRAVYETFAAEHEVVIEGTFWDDLSFQEETGSETTGFFQMYQDMWK